VLPAYHAESAARGIDAAVGVCERQGGIVLGNAQRTPSPVAELADALGGE